MYNISWKDKPIQIRIEVIAYDNHTTKRRRFKHLSEAERRIIEKLLELEYGIREIARELGRSANTISREVKRGTAT